MFQLALPDANRYADWAAAFNEFGDRPKDGTGFRASDVVDTSPRAFEEYLGRCARQRDVTTPPEPGLVPCTYFWMLNDDELVGFLALRHALNEFLLEVAGHIGYSVLPNHRRRGYATKALELGLEEATKLGISPVMVTCAIENVASRAVIEHCGGQFDDLRGDTRRYWFGPRPWPTSPTWVEPAPGEG